MRKINNRIQSSTDSYVEELFDAYSKLNVIRLDLSYKKEIAENITPKEVKKRFK